MKYSQLISVQQNSGNTSIALPARQLGKSRFLGWIPILIGVLVLIFGITWMSFLWGMQADFGGQRPQGLDWILVAFGGIGLVPCFIGVKTGASGIAVLSNRMRTTIVLKNRTLVVFEKFFVFSFKRKVPLLGINQLTIQNLLSFTANGKPPESDDDSRMPEFLTDLVPDDCCALTTKPIKGQLIAIAYPEAVLLEAAQAIQAELNKVEVQLPSDIVVIDGVVPNPALAKPTTVEVVNWVSGHRGAADSVGEAETDEAAPYKLPAADLQLPLESLLSVSQKDGADVYQIPAPGFRKSSTLFFGLLWNGFLTVFTAVIVLSFINPNNAQPVGWPEILGVSAFLALFWAVGIGLALWTLDMARRSVMIGVTGPLMFIETKGVFGTKWVEFDRKQISSIAVRNSNTSVNDKPIRHLVVETVDGQTRGMFNNLEEEELQWLAAQLKNSLQLTFKSRLDVKRAWDEEGTLILPEATRIKVEEHVGETVIEIPPGTLLQHFGNLFGTLLAMAFFIGFIYLGITQGGLMFILIPSLMAIVILALGIAKQMSLRRRWSVRASRQRLTIKRRGVFSVKNHEVDIDRLKKVDLHSTGWLTGNQKQYELHVHRNDAAEKIKLLAGWSIVELRYVAGLILEAVDRKPPTDAAPPQEM